MIQILFINDLKRALELLNCKEVSRTAKNHQIKAPVGKAIKNEKTPTNGKNHFEQQTDKNFNQFQTGNETCSIASS